MGASSAIEAVLFGFSFPFALGFVLLVEFDMAAVCVFFPRSLSSIIANELALDPLPCVLRPLAVDGLLITVGTVAGLVGGKLGSGVDASSDDSDIVVRTIEGVGEVWESTETLFDLGLVMC